MAKLLNLSTSQRNHVIASVEFLRPPGHLCWPLTVTCTPGLCRGLCRSASSLRRYLHRYAQNDQNHELCHSPTDLALSNENVMDCLHDEFIFTAVTALLQYVITSLESGHQAMTFQSLHIVHHQATPGTAHSTSRPKKTRRIAASHMFLAKRSQYHLASSALLQRRNKLVKRKSYEPQCFACKARIPTLC